MSVEMCLRYLLLYRYYPAYSDVGPAVHLALRPLHHGRLRAHLRVAVRVAVVLQRAVPHHRHRPRLHLHPRPHVPRQVPRPQCCVQCTVAMAENVSPNIWIEVDIGEAINLSIYLLNLFTVD